MTFSVPFLVECDLSVAAIANLLAILTALIFIAHRHCATQAAPVQSETPETSSKPASPTHVFAAQKPSAIASTPAPAPPTTMVATTATTTTAAKPTQIPAPPSNNRTPSLPASLNLNLNQAVLPWRASFSHLVRRRSSTVSTGFMTAVSVSDTVLGRKGSACTTRWSSDDGSSSEGAASGPIDAGSEPDAGESTSVLAGVGEQFQCFERSGW
ncbi:hypothetical protein N657DRAFT_631005 [Parathielavia appendiculata]|uniref:Uncharacterized protein n=1 Tax=Parathielavia appendiculata TaxID=2587402 RepID=A0AAN6Z7H6_9PEZI|nr:hypothetical protein N657DRAFT_631005 [Parathielavia appendiculata]